MRSGDCPLVVDVGVDASAVTQLRAESAHLGSTHAQGEIPRQPGYRVGRVAFAVPLKSDAPLAAIPRQDCRTHPVFVFNVDTVVATNDQGSAVVTRHRAAWIFKGNFALGNCQWFVAVCENTQGASGIRPARDVVFREKRILLAPTQDAEQQAWS